MIAIKAKENYKFYDLNREAINEGHIGDYVLIRDCAVAGYFKDIESAYSPLKGTNAEPGSFIIHECLPEEDEYADIGFRQPIAAFEVDWK
ncbi:hypothetical protein FACS1894200_02580 [Spirochaetia bacterium]|nr:hypothetical protein FACS1894200_02580 [Spirochaetia bacterium]